VWTVNGKRVTSLTFQGSHYQAAAAWSPDGQWLAGGNNTGQVHLWKTEGFKAGPVIEVDDLAINCIAWSADSLMFATGHSGSNKIRIWNSDGTVERELKTANAQVHCVAWSPRGNKLVSSGTQVKVHDLEDDSRSVVPTHNGGVIFGVCWHPDGNRFASVDEQRQIRLWKQDGALLRAAPSYPDLSHSSVKWSHDGEFVASTSDGQRGIWLWNARGVSQAIIKGGRPIAWHPTKCQIAGRDGNDLQLWDSQGKLLSTAVQTNSSPWSVAWSPDGKLLAVGDQFGLVEIWEPGRKRLATWQGHESGMISDIAWSPDGNALVTGSADSTARFWKRDGTPGIVMKQPGQCRSVAWNPTGDRIAVSSDTTGIWNLDGTSGPALKGLSNGYSVDWSPDGKRLVTGSYDRTVRLWSDEGLPQSVLREHDCIVHSVDWSPTGSHFASAADDGTTIVWDVQTTEPLWVGVQLGERETATFSAAGQVLDGDPDVLEEHFVYLVENEDGQQELLKPSEFQERINPSRR
jgi:WD40 repeat protein